MSERKRRTIAEARDARITSWQERPKVRVRRRLLHQMPTLEELGPYKGSLWMETLIKQGLECALCHKPNTRKRRLRANVQGQLVCYVCYEQGSW